MARLVESSWLPQAKRLNEGERKYVNHDCGSGRTLVISASDTGWSGHCFRCNLDGWVGYGIRRIADLNLLRRKEIRYENSTTCKLPEDFTQCIPSEYYVWLSKNSISPDMVRMYNVGWSASLKRIILPVYGDDGELIFIQARAVESWRKPKYLNMSALPKTSVTFYSRYGMAGYSIRREYNASEDGVCCITEDIASAMRTGLYLPSYSFFGTSMSPEQASIISSRHANALVWYDSDTAGINGCIKVQRGLRILGVNSKSIQTPSDPKLYSNRLIAEALSTGGISGRDRPNYPTYYEGEGILRQDVCKLANRMF